MGSFNVACSASSISIGSGTRVAFFPLKPNGGHGPRRGHVIEPSTTIIYAHDHFKPAALPIFGKYNDYGGLEDIEEDDNTRALEKHYGLPIQALVDVFTCNRKSISDSYSEIHAHFAVDKGIGDHTLDAALLGKLGFTEFAPDRFRYDGDNYEIQLSTVLVNGKDAVHAYTILDADGNVLRKNSGYGVVRKFIDDFGDLTGILLNVTKENQKNVKQLLQYSGMFVHGEIYDELARSSNHWRPIDVQADYQKMVPTLNTYIAERKEFKVLQAIPFRTFEEDSRYNELLFRSFYNRPFERASRDENRLADFLSNIPNVQQTYAESVANGQLLPEITAYYHFYINFISMNRFFFPAYNGEQCGDHPASKRLLEKSLEIVNAEIAKYDE